MGRSRVKSNSISNHPNISQSIHPKVNRKMGFYEERADAENAIPLSSSESSDEKLSQSIWETFLATKQTEETFAKKMKIWQVLFKCIQNMSWLPKYELYLMGSTITGYGTNNSDIDICMVDTDGATYCDSRTEALHNLWLVKNFIESSPSLHFEHIKMVRAKVPILRFRHTKENIDIDLSFNNSEGIRNTHLLHCYAQLDWRVRPLVVIIKQWAQHHNLNDPKNATMSSYSLVLMVINFLQAGVSPAVLPCLHNIYPDKFASDTYWNNLLESIAPYPTENRESLGELLLKFFKYYADFDYSNSMISVRTGGLLPKTEYNWNNSKMISHVCNFLWIEEPFNRTNTGKSVHNEYVFQQIKLAFHASWKMLQESQDLSILFLEPLFTPSMLPSSHSYF
ncbi:poly(A) RNA polymerase gld-2 homolog A-like [Anopheles nili]|uniref:poly(A) RNA polymerase gld-2 homolog A-like n=1 Tax=Anopheles nili TaxID=185578 RepID=UPI00237B5539|nr:poly(A) RNA polymerase gld-2 homolog A-like [Anopheles nili]